MIPAELRAAEFGTLLVGFPMHPARKRSYSDVFSDKAWQGPYQLAPYISNGTIMTAGPQIEREYAGLIRERGKARSASTCQEVMLIRTSYESS